MKQQVFDCIMSAGRPISVEEIAFRTRISVDIVGRYVAELLQDGRIKVDTRAPVEELELQLA